MPFKLNPFTSNFDEVIDGSGFGDVTAAANLTDDAVVVGDGGAKGIKTLASLGTSGQVLTSNGAGNPPSFEDAADGDVVGPASATDNAVARYNATTGKLIQNSTVIVSDDGEMTNASQPIFNAYVTSTEANVTGDGTSFFLGDTSVGTALTELVDQGGNFTTGASGGAFFTAPVTGNYQFNFSVLLQDLNTSHTSAMSIVTTTDVFNFGNYAAGQPAGNFPLGFSICIPLTAGDTARFSLTCGGSTKTVDVNGGGDSRTYVSGFLIG